MITKKKEFLSSIFIEAFFQIGRGRKKTFFLSFSCTLFFSFVSCIASPSRLFLLFFFANPSKYPLFRPLFYLSPPPSSYHSFFRIFFSFSSLILFPSARPALLPLSHIHFFSFLFFFSKIVPKSISDQRLHLSFSLWWPYRTFFPALCFPPQMMFFIRTHFDCCEGVFGRFKHTVIFLLKVQWDMGMPGQSAFLYFYPFLSSFRDILFFFFPFFSRKRKGKHSFWAPEMEVEAFFAFVLFFFCC